MEQVLQQIDQYKKEIDQWVIGSAEDLENYRIRFLGTKGVVKALFGEMKNIPAEEKRSFGQVLNDFKQLAESKYEEHKDVTAGQGEENKGIDLTLPGDAFTLGTRHPLSLVRNRIVSIYQRLGFAVAEGPEIEDDWHNFTALNMPENHPARDMQDTFYIQRNPDWVLRTHTSSVQARVLETSPLPVRIICPGRVYRNETVSARANCFFHQVEGLYVDKHVSFADLKQTLYFFVREMFGEHTRVRFRPSYFPFTEPSAEMDISCTVCGGSGCSLCKHTGWVEILGCGMVHPQLLENLGIDSTEYTGFAFGMGVERIAQLNFRVNDLRLYAQNDLRFLQQFTSST
jgi:phenylalanyl-tRNA synthetase alpha chain